MQKLFRLTLIITVTASAAIAAPTAPEIDPTGCASAVALLGGVLLVARGRWRR